MSLDFDTLEQVKVQFNLGFKGGRLMIETIVDGKTINTSIGDTPYLRGMGVPDTDIGKGSVNYQLEKVKEVLSEKVLKILERHNVKSF